MISMIASCSHDGGFHLIRQRCRVDPRSRHPPAKLRLSDFAPTMTQATRRILIALLLAPILAACAHSAVPVCLPSNVQSSTEGKSIIAIASELKEVLTGRRFDHTVSVLLWPTSTNYDTRSSEIERHLDYVESRIEACLKNDRIEVASLKVIDAQREFRESIEPDTPVEALYRQILEKYKVDAVVFRTVEYPLTGAIRVTYRLSSSSKNFTLSNSLSIAYPLIRAYKSNYAVTKNTPVYRHPDFNSGIIAKLAEGGTITITHKVIDWNGNRLGDWYKIEARDGTGFISLENISWSDPPPDHGTKFNCTDLQQDAERRDVLDLRYQYIKDRVQNECKSPAERKLVKECLGKLIDNISLHRGHRNTLIDLVNLHCDR